MKIKSSTPNPVEGYNGYSNHKTWEVATTIANDPALYDLCRCLYEDGYKSFGAMCCKLKEYGPRWQSTYTGINYLVWKDQNIRSAEITKLLKDLYDKN